MTEKQLKENYPEQHKKMREICKQNICVNECPLFGTCPRDFDPWDIDLIYTRMFGSKIEIQEKDIMSLLGE